MPTKDRLTVEQLRTKPVYLELTSKQRKLVETFIETGDRVQAMLAAYKIKSPETARVLAYDYFASPRVIAALAAYFQSDPLEAFKAEVRAAYRSKKLTVAQVNLMKLHADLNGWGSTSLPSLHGRDTRAPEPGEPEDEPASMDIEVTAAPSPKTFDASTDPRVPETAMKVWLDASGALIGYRDANGTDVRL